MKHIRWKGGERVVIKVYGERRNEGREIEDEMMKEEREIREPTKVVESIESPRFN